MIKRTRTFIVDEHTAINVTIYFLGREHWRIMNRTQLNDGRWQIDCEEA